LKLGKYELTVIFVKLVEPENVKLFMSDMLYIVPEFVTVEGIDTLVIEVAGVMLVILTFVPLKLEKLYVIPPVVEAKFVIN
jgi:hypothetical protein